LFGYARGAFTDARKDKPGRFVLADKGTLFLDEVGDMSPAMQVKLLRALEEKQFIHLGGTVPLKADVRIIAATNRSLKDLVDEKLFREDLYYRLNIITIDLPPLCERPEDIPLLTGHLVSRLNALKGRTITGVSDEAMGMLMNHDFPGNVRELENILEHAYVLCKGALIEPRHLPVHLVERFADHGQAAPAPKALASSEALTIRKVLEKHGGNKVRAARELGIGRSTLWRKMKQLNLT
jgi:transcriptional regulator with PAS, ATPase and Fis domain